MNNLKKESSDCKAENVDLIGKLKMTTSELSNAKASLDSMNKGSKKLDEILGAKRLTRQKLEFATLMDRRHQKTKVNLYLF